MCVCVCMYVCMYIHIYIYIYICTIVLTHKLGMNKTDRRIDGVTKSSGATYTYTHIRIHIHTYIYIYTRLDPQTWDKQGGKCMYTMYTYKIFLLLKLG